MTLLCIKHGFDHTMHGNATIDCHGEYQLEPVKQSDESVGFIAVCQICQTSHAVKQSIFFSLLRSS